MSEFTEIINPEDFAEENPVAVTPEEKKFVEEFVKGATLEQAAESADLGFTYALKLTQRADVQALLKASSEAMGGVGELQKREASSFLAEVSRVRPTDFYTEGGDLDFRKLKEARVPIESIKIRKDPVGNIISQDIRFPSAMDAIKTTAKLSGWEAPKEVNVSGYIGGLSSDIIKLLEEPVDAEIIEDEESDEEKMRRLLGE